MELAWRHRTDRAEAMIVVVKVRGIGHYPTRGRFMAWFVSTHPRSTEWSVVDPMGSEQDKPYDGFHTLNVLSGYFTNGVGVRHDEPWNGGR